MKTIYKLHLNPLITMTEVYVYRIQTPETFLEKINIFKRIIKKEEIYYHAYFNGDLFNEITRIKQNMPQIIADYEQRRRLIETHQKIIENALSEEYTSVNKNKSGLK